MAIKLNVLYAPRLFFSISNVNEYGKDFIVGQLFLILNNHDHPRIKKQVSFFFKNLFVNFN